LLSPLLDLSDRRVKTLHRSGRFGGGPRLLVTTLRHLLAGGGGAVGGLPGAFGFLAEGFGAGVAGGATCAIGSKPAVCRTSAYSSVRCLHSTVVDRASHSSGVRVAAKLGSVRTRIASRSRIAMVLLLSPYLTG
jgi:hypothetical protein